MGQLIDIEELAQKLDRIRSKKRIILCHGVFDLLHIGHIRYLKRSKEIADILVVTVTPDKYVNKGPNRPAFPEYLRAEAIASLECVDFVSINKWPTAVNTIHLLKPHFYSKGDEYRNLEDDITGGIIKEKDAIEKIGGKMIFIKDITFSSSSLINTYFSSISQEAKKFIEHIKNKYSPKDINNLFSKMEDLKVTVLGEAIIDEYHYCETMGKSGKEPILAARFLAKERFAGGTLAIANHLSSFSRDVNLITFVGTNKDQIQFINEKLSTSVKKNFIEIPGTTIVKRRYVEKYPFQKLFEIYFMNGLENGEYSQKLIDQISSLPPMDIFLIADYGHGMLNEEVRDYISKMDTFLTVNTQLNADNIGFNTISKYKKADLVCISEKELRIEMRSKNKPVEYLIKKLYNSFNYKYIVVTMGEKGSVGYSKDTDLVYSPAIIKSFKDRIGAGDTVLSIITLLLKINAPLDLTLFIGNCAGAMAVNTVCNKNFLDKTSLLKFINTLLK